MRLMSTGYINNPYLIHRIDVLQMISLRVMEIETVELQKLKVKIIDIVDDFKGALETRLRERRENPGLQDIPLQYQLYLDCLEMDEPKVPTENAESPFITMNAFQSCSVIDDNRTLQESFLRESNRSIFPLNKLPSEILHLIFDNFTPKSDIASLLTVCKVWVFIIVKILYYRPHIGKRIQLDLFLRTMKLDSKDTVFIYHLMIKRLNFSFVGEYLYDKGLYNFVGCYNLERLTLVFCRHITSRPVAVVLEGCKYLQSVDITGIKEIYDDVFLTLADSCKRVQGFYVPLAKNVSFYALQMFTSNTSMLKRVKITSNALMDDKILETLADKCPMLVEVDITNSANVTDNGLVKLFLKL